MSSAEYQYKTRVSTTPLYRNESFLRQKYEAEGLSARQIAVLIGTSHSVINRAIKQFQLTSRPHRGGWIEYGFKRHKGKVAPHVREQIIIKRIIAWRNAKWSYSRIASSLNRSGIRSPAGKGQWYPATVKRILIKHQGTVRSNN